MKFLLLLIMLILFSANASAASAPLIIDLYKTNQITLDQILKKHKKHFQKIADIISSSQEINSDKNQKTLLKTTEKIISNIKKMGDFYYVNLSPVIYPNNKTVYITIDIVDQNDEKRKIKFLDQPQKTIPDPDHLISTWDEYQKIGFDLYIKNKIPSQVKSCPAYHCTFGFNDSALKKYQTLFATFVPKNKLQLVQILKSDKDENKRATAAFLLAHLKNGEEIIKILTPSIYDPSNGVRNNVMRVLAETFSKVNNPHFKIKYAIAALSFPAASDRNKALYMISELVDHARYANYVHLRAKNELLEELKLSQLNVHGLAYEILKKISGKDFGDRDYLSWEQWLKK